jgi:hypothetical protein
MNLFPLRLAGACVIGALLTAAGAQALPAPGVVQITASRVKHTHVDAGARGRSIGDVDIYTSGLYNKRITPHAIGHTSMVCTSVTLATQSCAATFFLPRGEIVTQGEVGTRLIYALAVTGGTGLYENVHGTLTVTSLQRNPERDLLVFRLAV